jgi:hypothetical protein
MRDVQSYGIIWLQGEERISKAYELQLANQQLLSFQEFVQRIKAPAAWFDIYHILFQVGIKPLDDLIQCINTLERLTNDIAISMNTVCSVTSYPELPLQCAMGSMQNRKLKAILLKIAYELLGCNPSPDSLSYILSDMLFQIEFYQLKPILGLRETLQKSQNLCLTIRILDRNMEGKSM